MFVKPAGVPVRFALTVYAVMHNQARAIHWKDLDRAHAQGKALGWIESIYKANNLEWSEAERQWWQAQLGSAPSLN